MALDIDDPSTYPDSLEELEALANSDGVDEGEVEEVKETETAEAEEETPTPEPTPAPADTGKEPDPEGVSTKDGKHVIPYSVLEAARKEAARAKELEIELNALRAQSQPKPKPKPADPTPAPPPADEVPQSVLDEVEKIRSDWGDTFAEQHLKNYKLEQRVLAQEKTLSELREARSTEVAARERTEQDQIAEATANSPTLVLWESQPESGWMNKSVELHTTLMKIDPAYSKLSWHDRLQVLPDKVKALYPDAPVVEAAKPKDTNTVVDEKVKEALQKADVTAPKSLSDIKGGEPDVNEDKLKTLENMSPAELQAHMEKLALTPDALENFLATL